MGTFHGFVAVQRRGTLALPPELRRRYHLTEPGAQVEITEREDGVLEIRPTIAIPASQSWFWTTDWQRREQEADQAVAAGELTVHPDAEEFLLGLDALGDESAANQSTAGNR